jgi:hypothetical protein
LSENGEAVLSGFFPCQRSPQFSNFGYHQNEKDFICASDLAERTAPPKSFLKDKKWRAGRNYF